MGAVLNIRISTPPPPKTKKKTEPNHYFDYFTLIFLSIFFFGSILYAQLVKELLEQVSEQAHKIENAKLCAVGTRNLVSAEVETRPRILRDQHNIISDKQDQLQVTIIFILFHDNIIIIIIIRYVAIG
jgi:hypothetical protein